MNGSAPSWPGDCRADPFANTGCSQNRATVPGEEKDLRTISEQTGQHGWPKR
jgi:hypothetical protein